MILPPLWPWQKRGIDECIRLLNAGYMQICRALPTGMGKTREQSELARYGLEQGWKVLLFVNQRSLTHQSGKSLEKAGLLPGYLAAGFDGPLSDLRVCSVQTVRRRHGKNLPECDLALVDEAHRRDFDYLLEGYKERGGTRVIGYTATPIGLDGKYQTIVQEGTKAEARKHAPPALVRCDVFSPSEPDMQGVKFTKEGEFSQKEMAKRVIQCNVFADVFDFWMAKNACRVPTLLWAPGIPESRWFVEEFRKRGVTAEHIDGDTPMDERDRIFAASKSGECQIVSSFGVLREGIDMPWIGYGILVQVCGALSTYLQIAGRILRAYEGKGIAILQEHAGAFHRHGSPNEDRVWELGDTNKEIRKKQKERRQQGEEAEPIRCPKCSAIRTGGPKCHNCGYEHTRSVRMVRTIEGELVKMMGSVTKKKKKVDEHQKVWTGCLFSAAARGQTLAQAMGMFKERTGTWLPGTVRPQPPADTLMKLRCVAELYPGFARR